MRMETAACTPYEEEQLARVCGPTLRPGGLELTKRAVRFCSFARGDRLLDVGCGSGASVAWLRQQNLAACGIDLSARLLTAGRRADLPLMRAAAEELPVGNATFDGLLCECVLCLLCEPRAALGEFARVLRPGGRLILSDLYLRAEEAAGSFPTRRKLLQELAAAGFSLQLWEDHSPRLAQLTAQLLLSQGSLEEICATLPEYNQGDRPGYYLLVAEKQELAAQVPVPMGQRT